MTKQSMQLTLEKPVYGGDCLAHSPQAGKAIFVPLTLPGEQVTAHITEDKSKYAKAELDKVITPSSDRVAPPCPHFGSCGGCHYQHASYPAQLALKQQILREALSRSGVPLPTAIYYLAAEPLHYRNRIRLALQSGNTFGYRSRRSHDIILIHECPIAAPILIQFASAVSKFLASNPCIVPLSEMELFTNHDQSELLLTLFTEASAATDLGLDLNPDLDRWLASLHATLPPQIRGIRLQGNDGALAAQVFAETGSPSLTYIAAGFNYTVPHGAFFQVNRHILATPGPDNFIARVTGNLSGKQAWDLYAGVGLFSRQLTKSFSEVHAVEIAPASIPALELNLAGTTARAIRSTTLDYLRSNRENREPRPDTIVLDPPRAGLGDQVTTLLNAIGAPEMVYVSCDPTTLARDLRALIAERYTLDSLTLIDMFPQTFHIEAVARLRRK
jgi:23S rRNA (uracil1939-C5)-methyltransferase